MYNRVILIGRIGREPDVHYMSDGQMGLMKFSLATHRRWQDKDGNWQEDTQWHSIIYWSRFVRNLKERLHKGDLVMVEGEIRYRQWEDRNGELRNTTEINAFRVIPLVRLEREVESVVGQLEPESSIAPSGEAAPPLTGEETEEETLPEEPETLPDEMPIEGVDEEDKGTLDDIPF